MRWLPAHDAADVPRHRGVLTRSQGGLSKEVAQHIAVVTASEAAVVGAAVLRV